MYICLCIHTCIQLCFLYFTAILPTLPAKIKFPVEYTTDVSFVVQWDAVNNQSVDRYIVNWTDGTNPIQTVTVNKTSYNVTELSPNTTYTVTVAAVNKYNCTGPSTNKRVTTNASLSVVISIDPTTATTVTTTTADTIDHTDTTTDSTTTSSIVTTITTILMAATNSTATSSTTTIDSNIVMPTITSTANVTSKFS